VESEAGKPNKATLAKVDVVRQLHAHVIFAEMMALEKP